MKVDSHMQTATTTTTTQVPQHDTVCRFFRLPAFGGLFVDCNGL